MAEKAVKYGSWGRNWGQKIAPFCKDLHCIFFCFKHPCTPLIVLHFICSKNLLLSSERSEFSANQANVRANGLKNVLQNILLTD